MTQGFEDDEIELQLLHRAGPKPSVVDGDVLFQRQDYRISSNPDRLQPYAAGGLSGLVAGASGLGVIHAMHATSIGHTVERLGQTLEFPPDASMPIAYVTAGLAGALVGMVFATVTRHLRRFVPLVVWALVFLLSLAMLLLALSAVYGRGLGVSMAPALLLATAAYALVVSLQLPLRKRI